MTVDKSSWKLGVDVGGTFTDAVLYNEETGEILRAKVPSTPQDQSEGVLNAITQIRSQLSVHEDVQISVLNHGTTVATNAILEGKGAHVALLVTEGYRDTLQVRRSAVPGGLAGWIVWTKPEPLAPLDMTIEVPGRIASSGEVVRPLDDTLLRSRLQKLKSLSPLPESITISLFNSFANPDHEVKAAKLVREEFPNIPISLSSDLLPEIMEYERTVTTVANAYVKPVVHKYLTNLQNRLGKTELRVLRSDGGLASVGVAKENCANLLFSGPAGGVAGVISHICHKTSFKNLLTFDMGGTSTDVCLIEDAIPVVRRESIIGDLTIRAPSLDVRTVGAGGGSIASVAEITGALRVGPDSAGAQPGPACYAQGGIYPTVTDAFAVLGYLPTALLGGSFQLDMSKAKTAIEKFISEPMNLSVFEAAEGIVRITTEKMYGSLRSVSVEKGKDPRLFHLVSFGGAGGLVACELSKLCGTAYPTIIPPSPGVLCALGDACTVLRHEVSMTLLRSISEDNTADIRQICSSLQQQASSILLQQGIATTSQHVNFEMDLRYRGQAASLTIPFDINELCEDRVASILARFEASHIQFFTFSLDFDVEMVNLRAIAEERARQSPIRELAKGKGVPSAKAQQSSTTIFHAGHKLADVPIFDRSILRAGDCMSGPCIISELDSNTFITPFHRAEIDHVGNILIWPMEAPSSIYVLTEQNFELDPIIVQLVEAGLQNTRVEMDTLIQRVAMSPAMREQLDYFPMIAAGDGPNSGKMVCGQFGSFIPGFIASWDESIQEGDVFLTNDPYSTQNAISHLNDFLVITPVHHEGKLIAWVANLGHFTDIGSIVPGSMPNCATSIFEDGIQIPLCKLYSAGVPNTAVFKIVERNSRKPDFAKSDLHALVAATKIGAKRVIDLCVRFGAAVYEKALDTLLERNKIAIGKLIKTTVPDEPIYFEDYIDDDGFGLGPWKIACTMKKHIDENDEATVIFDFDGTDPQSERSINLALSHEMLKMFIVIFLLTVFDPSTIVNDGAFDLIKIIIPAGTILNPIRPAALSCRTHLLGRLFDVIGALFGQRQPEFLSAAGFSDSPHFFYSGWTNKGEWFQLYQIGFGGIPARPHGDGPDGHSLWPSMRSVPNEFLESYLPLRVDRYETVPDSGGEGLYRGGNAMRIDYTFLENGNISLHDDRWLTKPWGVHGGGVGARSSKTLVRYSVDATNPPRTQLKSKEDFIEVFAGDMLEWITWGGGGWGSPLDRDAHLVAKEVRRGLVNDASRYGVVLTPEQQVDIDATNNLRASMAATQSLCSQELFNRGGTLKEITEKCLEETGLPPPKPPSCRTLRGPIAQIPYIRELHERRAQEDRKLYGTFDPTAEDIM
ncbi:Hydantoinase/oxoprolinase-domain-containing protein [Crucibulum laeve]|uniref:Hydantoinase/oxoprolinase-domain-containing protein n=1 Tax=Crucibulum laeve TaxID=68775 RepID=A0A5C3MD52_9AGAR|nr:Hydantoinase/oxoprolinase-domain-containing protein [Crucibulum laeve]